MTYEAVQATGTPAAGDGADEEARSKSIFNSSLSFLAKEDFAPLQSSLSAGQQEPAVDSGARVLPPPSPRAG
jgi:hypothetical protein